MTCDECGAENPVVHLTEMVKDQMTMLHLCKACAADKGLDSSPTPVSPLTDFISKLGTEAPQRTGTGSRDRCPFCGLTYRDFKEVGRLGCPECWTTFQPALEKLLRRIHGSTHHAGKVYLPPEPSASEVEKRLQGLRNRLERAVDGEDFERAANLRDQIRALDVEG